MNGFNKVIVAGNLTRDPELRYTPNGTAIAKGGVALNRQWSSGGERKQETTFVDWTAFGDTAALMAEHTRKGQGILLEGRLQMECWQDRQTQAPRQRLIVLVERVVFFPETQNQSTGEHERPPKPAQPERRPEPEEDDVPF
jgi:single-strand DNA-binding protein